MSMAILSTAGVNVADDFLEQYVAKVDSGFGLIQGDVEGVFATLIIISVGVSALFWAVDENQNVPAALVRKILLFGLFAWLITSWHALSLTVVNGFAALGLKAAGGGLGLHDLMNAPSKVFGDGLKDAAALFSYISQLCQQGFGANVFRNLGVILAAAVTAVGLMLAFLILAVEIAVTIIEFHLVTLIALVTVPFGVLTQTAFLAERAIGYVASVGVKLMAIAIIVSIGETIFSQFTVSATPGWDEMGGLLLSAVLILTLALKVPAVAGALISGGPHLSAGSAVTGAAGLAATIGGLALMARMGAGAAFGAAKVAGASAAGGAKPTSPPPSAPGGGPSGGGGDAETSSPGEADGGGTSADLSARTKSMGDGAKGAAPSGERSSPKPADADEVVARARARRDRFVAQATAAAARRALEDGGGGAGQTANLQPGAPTLDPEAP